MCMELFRLSVNTFIVNDCNWAIKKKNYMNLIKKVLCRTVFNSLTVEKIKMSEKVE